MCNSDCLSCNNDQTCLSCITKYLLPNNTCIDTCPDSYFNNNDLKICSPCSS